jgi:hypothetical protein
MVPHLSIRDQIKKLVELQKMDTEIYNYKKDLEEKPAYIAELKENFESKKARLKELEDTLKVIQVDRKSKELELKGKEDELTKANVQLSQIKTNKEYTAKLTEMENIKADKSRIEEAILMTYDESDQLKKDIEKEKGFLSEEEKKYLSEKKIVDESIKEIQEKLKLLENKRNQITPDIDKDHLARYEKILKNKEGLAMAPVHGNSCGGCFMNVPDQIINEMKMHDKLIVCEMCARILYLEDDL